MPTPTTLSGVTFPTDQIAEICRRFGITRLSLFGSVIRNDFHAESDVDILVEFAPTTRIGLIGVATMGADLTDAIGRRVDSRSARNLSGYFCDKVIAGARLLHVGALYPTAECVHRCWARSGLDLPDKWTA